MSKKLWYEQYSELSSSIFTFGNSGNKINASSDYAEKRDEDYNIIGISARWGSSYAILGYSKNPPFQPFGYHAIAIMFEHERTHEQIWFHFRSGKNVDMSQFKSDCYGDVEQLRFESDELWRAEEQAREDAELEAEENKIENN